MIWLPRTHLTDRVAQKTDVYCETLATAIIKVDRKKICAAGNAMTPIISHTGNMAVNAKTEQWYLALMVRASCSRLRHQKATGSAALTHPCYSY